MTVKVPRRSLGRTGIEVSLLGLGTVAFGRGSDLRYPRRVERPNDVALARLLDRARELGIDLVDTAPAYGDSEARLGRFIAKDRERWVVCTKTGEEWSEGAGSRFDFSARHTEASVRRSLERLRTDYLDVVLLHSNGDDLALLHGEAMDALAKLKARGLVRAFGVSHKTRAGGLAAVEVCDVVMTTLSRDDATQLDVVEAAGASGCGVLVKKALASGHTADPDASLRFVASRPGVSSIVVGTLDPAHLEANARALGSGPGLTRA